MKRNMRFLIIGIILFITGCCIFIYEISCFKYTDSINANKLITNIKTYEYSLNKDDVFYIDGENIKLNIIENNDINSKVFIKIKYFEEITKLDYSYEEESYNNGVTLKNIDIDSELKFNNKYFGTLLNNIVDDMRGKVIHNYQSLTRVEVDVEVPKGMKNSITYDVSSQAKPLN